LLLLVLPLLHQVNRIENAAERRRRPKRCRSESPIRQIEQVEQFEHKLKYPRTQLELSAKNFADLNQQDDDELQEIPLENGLKTLESTLETRKRILGVHHVSTLRSMKILGDRYFELGFGEKAVVLFVERLKAASELVQKPDDPGLAIIKNDLGLAYSRLGKFAEAAKIGEELNEILPRVFARESNNFLTMRYNLGYYYEFMGKLKEAMEIYEEVLEGCKLMKDNDNRTMNLTMVGLESVYLRMGRFNESMKICEDLVAVQEKLVGEQDPATLGFMKMLAQHYKDRRHLKDAVKLYERIVEIRKRASGPEHADTLTAMSDLAGAYIADGQKGAARKLLTETLHVRERVLGLEHLDTLQNMDDLAMIREVKLS
jgi:tetratricopeptide (TPR) repeat protein